MKTSRPTPTFTLSVWSAVVAGLAESFRLSEEEAKALADSKTARLIAALPYLAGCDQAERTAYAHVAVYVLSYRGPSRAVFDHAPTDDSELARRLALIADFQGGDARILRRGMNLLTLQMICGYARDQAKDLVTGEYNPLLAGAWDATAIVDRLVKQVVDSPSPEMDALFSVEDAQWEWWF